MRHASVRRLHASCVLRGALVLGSATVLVACPAEAPRAARTPPAAEFLLTAGDSTFWVKTTEHGIAIRGAPIVLARIGGRFYELYVADDDRSFRRALFIGQRLYRRDLLGGDSAVIFSDTVVPRMARDYQRRHPRERPLAAEEDADDDLALEAGAEIELLDVFGRFVSIEYHVDLRDETGESHAVRRAVLDGLDARRAELPELFGDTTAARVWGEGEAAFGASIDSVLATRDRRARRAATALADFTFDSSSFALAQEGRKVAVAFLAPGSGERAGGLGLPLPPVIAGAPAWWTPVLPELPDAAPDSMADRWRREGYDVVARYRPGGESMTLALASAETAWTTAGMLPVPARRIFWLDRPAVDSATRRALRRAFDEASLYSDEARRVMRRTVSPVRPRLAGRRAKRERTPVRFAGVAR